MEAFYLFNGVEYMVSPLEVEIIGKLIMAAAVGAIIGLEREIHHRPAGMRTHALVCMGATLFTLGSLHFAAPDIDASRIASGVVTGIGFLAAGVIFRADDKVRGITTAAELWVLAAIGVSIGIGFYFAAAVTAVIVWIVLVPLKSLETKAVESFDKSESKKKKGRAKERILNG